MSKTRSFRILTVITVFALITAFSGVYAYAFSTYVRFSDVLISVGKSKKVTSENTYLTAGNSYVVVISKNTANSPVYATLVTSDGTMSTTGLISGVGNTTVYVSTSGYYNLYLNNNGNYNTRVTGYYRSLTKSAGFEEDAAVQLIETDTAVQLVEESAPDAQLVEEPDADTQLVENPD